MNCGVPLVQGGNVQRCGLVKVRAPIALHWCRLFSWPYSWAGYGQSNSVAEVPTVLKWNVITFLCFASLHTCKLTRATCKVRTVVCSCGFYPFFTIICGSHCTWSIVWTQRENVLCVFFSSSNSKWEMLALPPFQFLSAHFVRLTFL